MQQCISNTASNKVEKQSIRELKEYALNQTSHTSCRQTLQHI